MITPRSVLTDGTRNPAASSWKIQGKSLAAGEFTHLKDPNYRVWLLCISRGEGKYELLKFPTGSFTEEPYQVEAWCSALLVTDSQSRRGACAALPLLGLEGSKSDDRRAQSWIVDLSSKCVPGQFVKYKYHS